MGMGRGRDVKEIDWMKGRDFGVRANACSVVWRNDQKIGKKEIEWGFGEIRSVNT